MAWARRVKPGYPGPPRLWLFTDAARLGDPLPAIRRLPRGLSGVVFRPEGYADRLATGQAVARACRERRVAVSVAGDWRLAAAMRAGLHLRGGRRPGPAPRWLRAATASAHDRVEAVRARHGGLVFLSPLFPTQSHPGWPALGLLRWRSLARGLEGPACLGGISGSTIRAVPRCCAAVGVLSALQRPIF